MLKVSCFDQTARHDRATLQDVSDRHQTKRRLSQPLRRNILPVSVEEFFVKEEELYARKARCQIKIT